MQSKLVKINEGGTQLSIIFSEKHDLYCFLQGVIETLMEIDLDTRIRPVIHLGNHGLRAGPFTQGFPKLMNLRYQEIKSHIPSSGS